MWKILIDEYWNSRTDTRIRNAYDQSQKDKGDLIINSSDKILEVAPVVQDQNYFMVIIEDPWDEMECVVIDFLFFFLEWKIVVFLLFYFRFYLFISVPHNLGVFSFVPLWIKVHLE